jgi:hypothetical protein
VAAFRLEGRHLDGALRWTLAVDTGELRRRRFPATVPVCLAATAPTGLSSSCGPLARPFLVDGTGLEPARLISNGRPFGEEVRATLLLREANLRWTFGRAGFATLRAGRARFAVADGLVHDDDATGVDLRLDLGALGPPFEVRAAAYQPTRDLPALDAVSPLFLVEAGWQVSLFERVGLFVAARRDRADGVALLFRGARLEDAALGLAGLTVGTPGYKAQAAYLTRVLSQRPASDATLGWVGTSGTLVPWRGHRVSWTGALLGGRIARLDAAPGVTVAEDVPLSGQAASVRWAWSPLDWLGLTPWFLYLSGDRSPYERRRLSLAGGYGGFLGVTPFLTATNLFFAGGLSQSFEAREATAPGVNGRGVLAPGLTLEVDLPADLDLTARAGWLRAPVTGPFGGRTYGTEIDLDLAWTARPWLTFAAEADVLFPGDFFGGRRAVSKIVLAVDLVTP